jgi:hypothetical protein
MTYMRSWKSHRLTSHTWLGLNPQIGRPLSRIFVPLVYLYFFLFNRENSKDKNRWRCLQGYQGDIGCPTGESSRTIVFHLICQQNIDDFWIRPFAVLRPWYEAVTSRQMFSGLYENSVWSELSEWCERNSLFLTVDKCKTITFSRIRYPVEFSYMLGRTVLDRG